MAPVIEVFEPRLFDGAVADEILASVEERLADQPRCSIALAGGRTPSSIYRALSKPPRVQSIAWESVDLFFGDERWVSKDDDQSNYRMVHETLLSQLKGAQPKVYPVDTSLASPALGAAQYAETIKQVAGSLTPKLDIVLLGIGEDGHTASLFPGAPAVTSHGAICQSVAGVASGSERVTIAADILFSAWRVFFIVKGERKADIVKRVIEGNDPPEKIPSRLYTSASAEISFFLDSGSAQKLGR